MSKTKTATEDKWSSDLELVGRQGVSALLNARFKLRGDKAIHKRTPYVWWERTGTGEMPTPLPTPEFFVSGKPMWRVKAIVEWYGDWKEVKR